MLDVEIAKKNEITEAINFGAFYLASIEKDDKLYHYTSKVGLEGILKSQALWATDYRYLNDKKEFSLVRTLVPIVIGEFQLDESRSKFIEQAILKEIDKMHDTSSKESNYYVTCFSLNTDSLLLWAEFADDGCSIGAHNREFLNMDSEKVVSLPGKVIYKQSEQLKIIRDCFEMVLDSRCSAQNFLTQIKDIHDGMVSEYVQSVSALLYYYSMYMKEEIYCGEEEYRIVFRLKEDEYGIRYRDKDGYESKIPYISVPFSRPIQIDNIRVNPKIHDVDRIAEYQKILRENKSQAKILESQADLRY